MPPWVYQNNQSDRTTRGGSIYPKLSQKDLCELPIYDVMDKDSLIFAWATGPKITECLEFLEKACKAKFVTIPFIWLKLNPKGFGEIIEQPKQVILHGGLYSGMGYYTNGNAEYVLLGKRGKGVNRVAKNIKQVIIEPRREHSSKPPELHSRLEKLYGKIPRLELFARQKRKGWTCLGDEISGNDIRDDLKDLL